MEVIVATEGRSVPEAGAEPGQDRRDGSAGNQFALDTSPGACWACSLTSQAR
jgi:hypothetical protein